MFLFHRCIRDFLSDKLAAFWKVHRSQEAVSSNVTCFLAAPCISVCFIAITVKQGLTLLILAADELSVSASFYLINSLTHVLNTIFSGSMGTEATSYTLQNRLSHTGVRCHHQESGE